MASKEAAPRISCGRCSTASRFSTSIKGGDHAESSRTSHIYIWDPKPDAPSNIRGAIKPIKTKIPGTWIGEHMPMMAQHLDKATLIRSMSYTPNGLFNHTAAIYQMLTGYAPDKASPSGQLEPPS